MRSVKQATTVLGGTALGSVLDWLRGFRNRLVANPNVQRTAIANPLTRRLARRKASELFDLCAGFVYSQILSACQRLGLFDLLRDRAMSLDQLAGEINLAPDATRRLVDAGVALRLLEYRSGGQRWIG